MSAIVHLRVLRSSADTDGVGTYAAYEVPHFLNMDILDALRYVRENLDSTLGFRAACGEGKCGLCGVLMNGRPVLACKERIEAGATLTLDPVPGFPIIRDLLVDRSSYYAEQRDLLARIEKPEAERVEVAPDEHDDYVAYKDCTECSLCVAGCPSAPALSHPHAGPAGFLQAVRAVHLERRAGASGGSELYRCLLCGQCVETCPRDVPVTHLNRAARGAAADTGVEPTEVTGFLRRLSEQRVIAVSGGHGTAGWLRHAPAEVQDRVQVRAPLGIFVGCQYGLRSLRSSTPIRLARLLLAAGVEFTLLGEDEWCCGHPNELAGQPVGIRDFAEHNIDAFRRLGVRKVVAGCPGCYTALATEYADVLGEPTGIAAEHASQYLLALLQEGRLKSRGEAAFRVAYHDPCELGRLHGLYDAPRRALQIAGIDVVEPSRSRELSRCCGAGGLAVATAPDVVSQTVARRMEELLESDPAAIVTACPNCETTLETALRPLKGRVRVLDLIDALFETLACGAGASADEGKQE